MSIFVDRFSIVKVTSKIAWGNIVQVLSGWLNERRKNKHDECKSVAVTKTNERAEQVAIAVMELSTQADRLVIYHWASALRQLNLRQMLAQFKRDVTACTHIFPNIHTCVHTSSHTYRFVWLNVVLLTKIYVWLFDPRAQHRCNVCLLFQFVTLPLATTSNIEYRIDWPCVKPIYLGSKGNSCNWNLRHTKTENDGNLLLLVYTLP